MVFSLCCVSWFVVSSGLLTTFYLCSLAVCGVLTLLCKLICCILWFTYYILITTSPLSLSLTFSLCYVSWFVRILWFTYYLLTTSPLSLSCELSCLLVCFFVRIHWFIYYLMTTSPLSLSCELTCLFVRILWFTYYLSALTVMWVDLFACLFLCTYRLVHYRFSLASLAFSRSW